MTIDTKDYGPIPFTFNPVQRYMLSEIDRGIKEGVRFFVVLKSRQEGITTLCCLIDTYFAFRHDGTKAAIIASDDDVRQTMRIMINGMVDSIPETSGWRYGTTVSNRTLMAFANRSHMFFLTASKGGTREGGELGRSKGLNFVHGSEMGLWGDPSNYYSLMPSLSTKNPNSLFLFEGTAKGLGLFWDMWREALESEEKRAIFLGWWRNPDRCLAPEDPSFPRYWDGRLRPDEEWVYEVKGRYGVEITEGQIAWYRKLMETDFHGRLDVTWQEFPPLPEMAFQTTSSVFFPSVVLSRLAQQERRDALRSIRFEYSADYTECKALDVEEGMADLKLWQYPVRDGTALYVIGADSAWGTSDHGDAFCASVWRCYANRVEQVAEFCTKSLATYQFAWTLCYLGGQFKPALLTLELAGGGASVFQEIQRIQGLPKRETASMPSTMLDFRGSMIHYLYKRPDSMNRPSVYHWKTTGGAGGTKERMMHNLRDLLMRGVVIPRSPELIDEMANIVQKGASFDTQRGHDDRVMAAAMACIGYTDTLIHSCAGKYWSPVTQGTEKVVREETVQQVRTKTVKEVVFDQFYNQLIHAGVLNKKQVEELKYGKSDEEGIPVA